MLRPASLGVRSVSTVLESSFFIKIRLKHFSKILLALLFIVSGVNHFISPGLYLQIMPPYLPWPSFLVYLSGFFEVALGALLLAPPVTKLAAWGLVLLLVTVFPANLHMAVSSEQYGNVPDILLWLRLPLQAVLIAWALWYTKPENGKAG